MIKKLEGAFARKEKTIRPATVKKIVAGVLLALLLTAAFFGGNREEEPEIPEMLVIETESTEPVTQPTTLPTEPEETEPEETIPEETEPKVERIHYDAVPNYFQNDYPDQRFGRGMVSDSGCSITCLAMVASYMTGHEYLPDELADYFGGYGQTNIHKLEYGSDKLQLPWRRAENVHDMLRAVNDGCLAILMMNENSIFCDSPHFIVVAGMTEDGKYLVNDPNKYTYEVWGPKQGFENGFEEISLIQGYAGGWIYDVSAMPEEPFIYEEIKPYVEPRYPGIELSAEEELLLAKLIWVEARGESAEGQQAVAEVIFNRMMMPDYPDTVYDVIHFDNQFAALEHLDDAEPTQAQYDAIEDALTGPYILPMEVIHFATTPLNEFVWGRIGGHVFCYRWGTVVEETTAATEEPA